MNRRQFLTAVGTTTGLTLSGCLGRFRTDTATSELGEQVSSRYGDFSLETVDAQQSVVTGRRNAPEVENPRGMYLLLIGGTTHEETISQDNINNFKGDFRFEYQNGNETGQIIFDQRLGTPETTLPQDFYLIIPLPYDRTSFETGTVVYETSSRNIRWDIPGILPDDVQSYMKSQPRFAVQNTAVPDSATGSASVSVTVAETASANLNTPEPFNIVLASGGSPDRAESIPIDGGETVTESFDVDLRPQDGRDMVIISWGREPQRYEVTVEQ